MLRASYSRACSPERFAHSSRLRRIAGALAARGACGRRWHAVIAPAMSELERLRQRLAAGGGQLPEELLVFVVKSVGPMLTAHDALVAFDVGEAEPFCPSLRLPEDADA
jgi:hypothetical protein